MFSERNNEDNGDYSPTSLLILEHNSFIKKSTESSVSSSSLSSFSILKNFPSLLLVSKIMQKLLVYLIKQNLGYVLMATGKIKLCIYLSLRAVFKILAKTLSTFRCMFHVSGWTTYIPQIGKLKVEQTEEKSSSALCHTSTTVIEDVEYDPKALLCRS
jgi:hypothetical protein